jgi:hypothetical protein
LLTDKVTALTPVPLRAIVCGLSLALSLMVNVPLYAPVAVGLKVTEIVHFAPAETEPLQLLVSAKFALATMLVIDSATLPVLVSVTFLVALVDPNATFPKLTVVGESKTVCACVVMVSRPSSPEKTNPRQHFRVNTTLFLRDVRLPEPGRRHTESATSAGTQSTSSGLLSKDIRGAGAVTSCK